MTPDLIKAITQPLPLAAGCVLLLSMLGLIWAKVGARLGAGGVIQRVAFLGGLFSLTVAVFSAYYSFEQMKSEREYSRLHAIYSVHAIIKGTVTGSKQKTLTFQTSSGQVNVGCNAMQSANVLWIAPEGATDISPRAEWRNIEKAQPQNQNVVVSGLSVSATGFISGMNRSFFGDCPGGGHGELVLSGTYSIPEREPHAQQTLKSLEDKVNRSQPLVIAIPQTADVTPETCDITIQGNDLREDIQIALQAIENEGTMRIEHSSGNIPYSLNFEQGRLTLIIK